MTHALSTMSPTIVRRLGTSPRERCQTEEFCPDVFELSDGQVAIIGTDRTEELDPQLPVDAARAPYERIVVIDRPVFLAAAATIR